MRVALFTVLLRIRQGWPLAFTRGQIPENGWGLMDGDLGSFRYVQWVLDRGNGKGTRTPLAQTR